MPVASPNLRLVDPFAASIRSATDANAPRRSLYASISVKYTAALCFAIAWTTLSICLSLGWLADLSQIVSRPMALIIIAFIAYVPGFMNAFMATSILLDRRPSHAPPAFYPPVSVLVACYNEAPNISDTLKSLAAQDYPGLLEVIVLNDGSTDDSMLVAARVIGQLQPSTRVRLKLVNFAANAGKSTVLKDRKSVV